MTHNELVRDLCTQDSIVVQNFAELMRFVLDGKAEVCEAAGQQRHVLLHGTGDFLHEECPRLALQRVFQVLHAGEVAENRLRGAAQRLRNGAGIHILHAFPAKHGKRRLQNHFPGNSLLWRHFFTPFTVFDLCYHVFGVSSTHDGQRFCLTRVTTAQGTLQFVFPHATINGM